MDQHRTRQSTDADRGQVNQSAAEIYAKFFVPALFAAWTARVADAAQVRPGQRVLDVACGTGVLTRTFAARTTPGGSVVGLDINQGMLRVAQQAAPEIEWRHGAAEELPFADDSFDAAASQFALMFFANRAKALQEMQRVVRPGGRLAVAVWDTLEHTPGYAAMVDLLRRHIGDEAAKALYAPYTLGDVDALEALCRQAGLKQVQITTYPSEARFPSLEGWVYTDIRGWTLAGSIDDEQYARLLQAAQRDLRMFVEADGSVRFAAPAHIVTATV